MTKNNLFAIDLDAADRAVVDANSDLSRRHSQLMEALKRMPTRLDTADEIDRAKRFAKQLSEASSLCRSTRLADTKPIRALLQRVEGFFKSMEEEANVARESVLSALSIEGRRHRDLAQADATAQVVQPVIVSVASGVVANTVPSEKRLAQIPLVDQVKAVDRDTLDLEALRPFFTDAALQTAARAHLKANGPRGLRGVTYEQYADLER